MSSQKNYNIIATIRCDEFLESKGKSNIEKAKYEIRLDGVILQKNGTKKHTHKELENSLWYAFCLCEIIVDHDEVAKAPQHYEAVEEFMISKVLESVLAEDWKLQCINDTSNGINDTADKKPHKCAM